MDSISVCGSDCAACYCKDRCAGCTACKGIVFHTGGVECAIYHCCVSERGYASCLECKEVPCGIWSRTRDPKFSDAEFEANVKDRLGRLKCRAGKQACKAE
jgi:hypothetical protein